MICELALDYREALEMGGTSGNLEDRQCYWDDGSEGSVRWPNSTGANLTYEGQPRHLDWWQAAARRASRSSRIAPTPYGLSPAPRSS